ncbi:MAG: hypothetical protein HY077_17400 [Elusimicrobia bacterium]|nr:hypothetical protein [Elusimicrobiota bacterium]
MNRLLILAVSLSLPGLAWSYGGYYGNSKTKKAPKTTGKQTVISANGAVTTAPQPSFNTATTGSSAGDSSSGGLQTNVFGKGGSSGSGGFKTNILGKGGKSGGSGTVSGGSVPTGIAAGAPAPGGVTGGGAPGAAATATGSSTSSTGSNGNCSKDQVLLSGKCVPLSQVTQSALGSAGASAATGQK